MQHRFTTAASILLFAMGALAAFAHFAGSDIRFGYMSPSEGSALVSSADQFISGMRYVYVAATIAAALLLADRHRWAPAATAISALSAITLWGVVYVSMQPSAVFLAAWVIATVHVAAHVAAYLVARLAARASA